VTHKSEENQRIAKMMARAGLCSRREAERWIEQGRVVVNGARLDTPAVFVSASDSVSVDGKSVQLFKGRGQLPRLWMYHKPMHEMTTHHDPEGRPTVFDNLPRDQVDRNHLITVGRLDYLSEGLLLFTDHGGLANIMMKPKTKLPRTYRVRVRGKIPSHMIEQIADGITIDGFHYAPIKAEMDGHRSGQNHWLRLTLFEGKNREIRRVMAHYGLDVSRLVRETYAEFSLKDLRSREFVQIPEAAVKSFLRKINWQDIN